MDRNIEYYIENLENEPFFKQFTKSQLNQIKTDSIIHQHIKGQIIYFQDDPNTYGHYLLDGLIRLEKNNQYSESFYVDYIKAQTYFAYGNLFDESGYTSSAYAVNDVDLLLIPRQLLKDILKENNDQLLYMTKEMARTLRFLEHRVQATAISSASERVIQNLAIWMFDLGKEKDSEIIISYPLTINELAQVAGTTRETAGRTVKNLTEANRIDFSRKRIRYMDPDYFFALLN